MYKEVYNCLYSKNNIHVIHVDRDIISTYLDSYFV